MARRRGRARAASARSRDDNPPDELMPRRCLRRVAGSDVAPLVHLSGRGCASLSSAPYKAYGLLGRKFQLGGLRIRQQRATAEHEPATRRLGAWCLRQCDIPLLYTEHDNSSFYNVVAVSHF